MEEEELRQKTAKMVQIPLAQPTLKEFLKICWAVIVRAGYCLVLGMWRREVGFTMWYNQYRIVLVCTVVKVPHLDELQIKKIFYMKRITKR